VHPTRVLFPLAVANLVALMVVSLGYLGPAGLGSASEVAFALAALGEELGLVVLLITGVTALVTLVAPAAGRVLGALLFTLVLGALFVDVRIFSLFRFHMNGLVWNVITTPGGFESAHIGTSDVVITLTALAVVLAVQLAGLRRLSRRRSRPPGPRRWLVFVAVVLVAGLAERVAFAAADIVDYVPVLRACRAVPFYQWITVKRELQRYGWVHADDEPTAAAPEAGTGLRYPRAPLATHRPAELPSILFVVLDSLREDFLTPELMPRLTRFTAGSEHWRAARSGGNSTRFGIFSLFYGLYGSYWHAFLGERRPPLLLDRVRELGYRTAALASAPLTSPEFRQTVFSAGADVMVDGLPGPTWQKDARLVGELRSFLAGTEAGRPWLAFVFFDSSHSGGTVPAAYARAGSSSTDYLALPSDALDQRARNRYEGALTYLDEVTERLLAVAAERDPNFAHTFVLVTGDHGQEFGEHGFHGHNSAFDPEQIRVPLIVRQPGFPPAQHDELVSLLDVVPTLGPLLGIENPPADYSQGVPLRTSAPRPPLVSCGWDECGLVDDRGVVVFGTATHRSGKFELRDGDYRLLDSTTLDPARRSRMTEVMSGLSAFVR
jgi:membrane-anchored protein YejM (alkaline phosphatase superfamily)